MNTDTLTKVEVQSINDVSLPNTASNKLRGVVTRVGPVYVCDGAHDEIPEKCFSRKELNYNELILEGEVESSDDESEYKEDFSVFCQCL